MIRQKSADVRAGMWCMVTMVTQSERRERAKGAWGTTQCNFICHSGFLMCVSCDKFVSCVTVCWCVLYVCEWVVLCLFHAFHEKSGGDRVRQCGCWVFLRVSCCLLCLTYLLVHISQVDGFCKISNIFHFLNLCFNIFLSLPPENEKWRGRGGWVWL